MQRRFLTNCFVAEEQTVIIDWESEANNYLLERAEEILFDEEESYVCHNNNADTSILRRAFNNIIFIERIHQVAYHKALEHSNLKEEENRASDIFKQLQTSLNSSEQKKLLSELESAWNNMYAIFLEYSYCQGIADSPIIYKELEDYGINILKEAA